jgi:predicted amino acid racemase
LFEVILTLPAIKIDLKKIKHNADIVTKACRTLGIEVVGVVKACLGSPKVAEAMIAGGVSMIADSRLRNLERLDGLGVPLMMLRQPMAQEIAKTVDITDICLISELKTAKNLSAAAEAAGKKYGVITMVETGDLREGVLPGDLFDFIKEVLTLPGIRLEGIGSNVACLQGVHPTPSMLELLVELAYELRGRFKIALPIISGGNSSAWKLIEAGSIPAGINQVRFGEGIILGRETVNFDPISGAFQDAVLVEAELIEVR